MERWACDVTVSPPVVASSFPCVGHNSNIGGDTELYGEGWVGGQHLGVRRRFVDNLNIHNMVCSVLNFWLDG